MPLGAGDYEEEMIKLLVQEGFNGPWGLLGHVEDEDVKSVLKRNIEGFNSLEIK